MDRLIEKEENCWPEYRRGKPITARQIASLLRPFGIVRGTRREARDTFKGYELSQFSSAFSRYLADLSVTRSQPAFQSHSDTSQSVTNDEGVTDTKTPKPAPQLRCDRVTDRKADNGARVWTKPEFTVIEGGQSEPIGYPSVTVLREFAVTEIIPAMQAGQQVVVLHLADHDPSGIDMTRDLIERLAVFIGERPNVRRIALNLDQVRELNPPENPAKQTDCRFADYARRFGRSSWELDALVPDYLAHLVRKHAAEFIDPDLWRESEQEVREVKTRLDKVIHAIEF